VRRKYGFVCEGEGAAGCTQESPEDADDAAQDLGPGMVPCAVVRYMCAPADLGSPLQPPPHLNTCSSQMEVARPYPTPMAMPPSASRQNSAVP
jgi:hypothetical protein